MIGIAALALAGALMAQGEPAAAAAAATDGVKPAAEAKKAKPGKVCVTEAQLGSHFKRRICATPEEWERRRVADQEAMSKSGGKTPSTCTGVAC